MLLSHRLTGSDFVFWTAAISTADCHAEVRARILNRFYHLQRRRCGSFRRWEFRVHSLWNFGFFRYFGAAGAFQKWHFWTCCIFVVFYCDRVVSAIWNDPQFGIVYSWIQLLFAAIKKDWFDRIPCYGQQWCCHIPTMLLPLILLIRNLIQGYPEGYVSLAVCIQIWHSFKTVIIPSTTALQLIMVPTQRGPEKLLIMSWTASCACRVLHSDRLVSFFPKFGMVFKKMTKESTVCWGCKANKVSL